jgi:hypothetical protein
MTGTLRQTLKHRIDQHVRQQLNPWAGWETHCDNCGQELPDDGIGRRFCGTPCRKKWHLRYTNNRRHR